MADFYCQPNKIKIISLKIKVLIFNIVKVAEWIYYH